VILLIDNFDSFTYNLKALLLQVLSLSNLDIPVKILRNNEFDPLKVASWDLKGLIISPGPGSPKDTGETMPLLKLLNNVPVLGICLGHQVLGEFYGGKVKRATKPLHGVAPLTYTSKSRLFAGINSPITTARYHSLIIDEETLPPILQVDARSEEGEIMAISHLRSPHFGLQFHPESFLTPNGTSLIKNFVSLL
jgi:anthranilate synthase/aminodeoxychorismate synthase-like glutamine amidotransferase